MMRLVFVLVPALAVGGVIGVLFGSQSAAAFACAFMAALGVSVTEPRAGRGER